MRLSTCHKRAGGDDPDKRTDFLCCNTHIFLRRNHTPLCSHDNEWPNVIHFETVSVSILIGKSVVRDECCHVAHTCEIDHTAVPRVMLSRRRFNRSRSDELLSEVAELFQRDRIYVAAAE